MNTFFYQGLVTNIAFPIIDTIVGTKLHEMYQNSKNLEYSSSSEIKNKQTQLLRKLLIHSYRNVPYYKELFDRIHLTNLENVSLDVLDRIPPLTKEIIQQNYDKLTSSDVKNRHFKIHSTGGSTGNPMKFILDLDSWSYTWANIFRGWGYANYRIGDRVLLLGSSSIFKDYKKSKEQRFLHTLFNFLSFPGMNMSDEICDEILRLIVSKKVKYLYGYSSAIYILAKYVIKKNIALKLNGIFPTSEMCPQYYKMEYQKAFQCNVVDCYGARDGGISAFECDSGMYHISENCIAKTEKLNLAGEVLCTDLYNYCMPFINYSVGDLLTLTDSDCNCGRGSACATQIVGRKEEIMQFKNGRNITGPGWTILFKDRSVAKYRLIKIDYESLEIHVVPSAEYVKDKEEQIIVSSIKKHVGDEINIRIIYCDDLKPLPNGKSGYFIG